MTSRRLLILSIAAVVAIAAGVWLAGRQSSSGSSAATNVLYPELKQQLDSVNTVRIFKAGDARAVELLHKESGWTVGERNGYPADETKVRKLLIGIADAKVYEEKTSNPEQYATLGVEDTSAANATGTRIELVGPPQPVNLIVGKEGPGTRAQYVRRAGEPQSWLINASIDTSTSPSEWLRKEVMDVPADRVQSATVSIKGAKAYTAAKDARADANFAVDGLPKGKKLSSEVAANGVATALSDLTLADVQPASALAGTAPDAHATLKTFDGLVVDVDGWTKDEKHYVALRTSFDAAQAERFKTTATPPEKEPDAAAKSAPENKAEQPPTAATPNVEEEAKTTAAKLEGWVYEIPQYKYETLFKPVEQLVAQ